MFNALMEPEDVVFPLPSTTYLESPRSAPLPPSASPSTPLSSYQFPPRSQEKENEHPLPTSTRESRHPYRPRPTRRTTKTKTKDWFPLKSFIDLHNDDNDHSSASPSAGWSWRSFIEVANVS
ncbi:hypothetical protein NLJ89_g145 [Agrocybe chaxingu]|uniref:Uncharacterized protein n=1 Tax=Agrocybe chaxingu TaxID=84603 RepID=A0A9W8N2P7_9AGAR|nr:hypothetical protein NLJ89_g145 [Agrocybe chaxingu]